MRACHEPLEKLFELYKSKPHDIGFFISYWYSWVKSFDGFWNINHVSKVQAICYGKGDVMKSIKDLYIWKCLQLILHVHQLHNEMSTYFKSINGLVGAIHQCWNLLFRDPLIQSCLLSHCYWWFWDPTTNFHWGMCKMCFGVLSFLINIYCREGKEWYFHEDASVYQNNGFSKVAL